MNDDLNDRNLNYENMIIKFGRMGKRTIRFLSSPFRVAYALVNGIVSLLTRDDVKILKGKRKK